MSGFDGVSHLEDAGPYLLATCFDSPALGNSDTGSSPCNE